MRNRALKKWLELSAAFFTEVILFSWASSGRAKDSSGMWILVDLVLAGLTILLAGSVARRGTSVFQQFLGCLLLPAPILLCVGHLMGAFH